jgi:hypothetical protein
MSVLRFSEPKKSIIFVVILQNCRKNITNFSKRDKLNVTTSSRQTKNVKPGVSFWNTLSAYLISETLLDPLRFDSRMTSGFLVTNN